MEPVDEGATVGFGREIIDAISGGCDGSALLIRSVPRLSGRNWHNRGLKPEHG